MRKICSIPNHIKKEYDAIEKDIDNLKQKQNDLIRKYFEIISNEPQYTYYHRRESEIVNIKNDIDFSQPVEQHFVFEDVNEQNKD